MANVEATNCRIVQSYGGLKEIYFEATPVTAADTISFPASFEVTDLKVVTLQDQADGTAKPYTITGTSDEIITVGTGPSADDMVGIAKFRSY